MPNNDLISRAELARDLSYSAPKLFFGKDYLMTKIARQPAVDAIPVAWMASWINRHPNDLRCVWFVSLEMEWRKEQEG